MDDGFGIPAHGEHPHTPHRARARYLVLIDTGGTSIARLFGETRAQIAEIDGGSEEVTQMTGGLQPAQGASGSEWDAALEGHNPAERADAQVYTLDL